MTKKQANKIVKHLNREELIEIILYYANFFESLTKANKKTYNKYYK